VVDLGSSVGLPAKLTLASVMVCPFLLPGRAVCPALGTRGTVDAWRAARPPGASRGANEAGPARSGCRAGSAQEPAWLVEGLRLGSGMPVPSGQIPPPWAWWENEAPAARTAGSPSQAACSGLRVGVLVRVR
jgi:hypothetical protein